MARIQYTSTKFVKPGSISERQFWAIKQELNRNPSFDFEPESESFTQRFSGQFKVIGGCFALAVIIFSIFEDGTPLIAVGGISMVISILSIFHLFIEAPSYATYSRKKRNYFSRMKIAIQESDSYDEFVNQFYIK